MVEAYAVAVRVRLINGVTSGLMSMSSAFAKVHGDATKLQSALDKIKFKLAAGGALVAGGALGFYLLDKTIKPATEYAHQLNIMHMAGMSNLEIAQATALAWKNTGTVITSTATGNLRAILDLKNILGSMQDAKFALPIVTKIGAVMASSSESRLSGNAQDIAFSMAKALDIIGAARDPKTFEHEAGLMSKVISAFQNRVTPKQFQGVFQYARQAKFDLSDEFKYEFLPSLMLEMASGSGSAGGGSRGVGPMLAAIYRVTNQGYINPKSVGLWERLGLVNPGSALKTSTTQTVIDPLKAHALAARNPFLFATQVMEPAIRKIFGNVSKEQERGIIGQLFRGNQLAASAMMEFISKPQNYLRDQAIIRKAMPYNQAYEQAKKSDPNFQFAALHAQYENALTALGIAALPLVIKGVRVLTSVIQPLGAWLIAHPDLTKGLVLGFGALSASMLFGGTVLLLSAAFDGIMLAMPVLAGGFELIGGVLIGLVSPVGLVVAGIAAVGYGLFQMWKNWDKTKGVIWNIKNEFSMFFGWLWAKVKWLASVLHLPSLWHKAVTDPAHRFHKALDEAEHIDAHGKSIPRTHDVPEPNLMAELWKGVQKFAASTASVYQKQHAKLLAREAPPTRAAALPKSVVNPAISFRESTRTAKATIAPQFTKLDLTEAFEKAVAAATGKIASSMKIVLNGQIVGQIISGEQGIAATKPSTGPNLFDTHLSPLRPDFAF